MKIKDNTQYILIKFLDYLKEGIIVVDSEKNIEFVNSYARKFFSCDEPEGKHFSEVVKNHYLYSIISYEDKRDKKVEMEIDEKKFLVNIYYIEDKKIIHLQDITPFEVYKQAKKDFVSNVSHELKTPISVLKSVMETLETETDPQITKKFIQMAQKRINQMDNLVQDLLILAKLESKEEKIQKSPVKLHSLVESIFEDLRHLTVEKSIKLNNLVPTDFNIIVDEQKFLIALKNLIENAIKYNKSYGIVKVYSHREGSNDTIVIEDSGIGIPKEAIPLIFERFYRVDKSRSRNIGGTGLGLSIVKHIIEAHKGKVWVESTYGVGSKFYIKLNREVT
ncbi:MAG: ATP-binding protein [Hydrogenothermaceae bacterium]|nr:ATP-binding protein [Hydrogenothermaceae bacterium]